MTSTIQETRRSLVPERILNLPLLRILFRLLVLAGGVYIVRTENEVYGALIYVLLISVILILSSRITDSTLPFLILCVFVTRCYDSFNTFIGFAWAIVPVLLALFFHFIYYRRKPKIGPSFWGLCAISVALILGGLGAITAEDYFQPITLFYTFGLGLGMIVAYLLVAPAIGRVEAVRFARYMYLMGLFAAFCVFNFYYIGWDTFVETKQCLSFQSSNNLSTFLMFALPFPFYYASKHRLNFLAVPVLYLAIILCDSRGGLVMGTLELLLLFILFSIYSPKNLPNRIICIVAFFGTIIALYYTLPEICNLYHFTLFDSEEFWARSLVGKVQYLYEVIVRDNEARSNLIPRAIEAFKNNPAFGSGLGDHSNADLYNPKKGFFNCYHMWAPQIIGSMGLVGVATYLFQLGQRVFLTFKNLSWMTVTCAASYLGLLLMSQVNPGEFCPMPYSFLAVMLFIIVEKNPVKNPVPAAKKKKQKTKENAK